MCGEPTALRPEHVFAKYRTALTERVDGIHFSEVLESLK
jgi:hypothetical protein